jgi:predicted nucleic acid-binding Zn finger protein
MALKEAKARGGLSKAAQERLVEVFGLRFVNASKALEEAKVRKIVFLPSNRVVWLVSGRGRDYVILPRARFCSCEDFYFRVISHEEFLCYHLLAQVFGEAWGNM